MAMNHHPFLINQRFAVDPALGIIRQPATGTEVRLEPRIMRLLCLLAASEGKLVSREYLTKEVWDNYGSADDGLTQAISYLRKILDDQERKLIETVPKKGYLLHGIISTEEIKQTVKTDAAVPGKSMARWLYGIVIAIALLLLLGYSLLTRKGQSTSPDVLDNQPKTNTQDSAAKKSSDVK